MGSNDPGSNPAGAWVPSLGPLVTRCVYLYVDQRKGSDGLTRACRVVAGDPGTPDGHLRF